MQKYNALFHPIDVRGVQINNRIVMTPMGTNFGETNGEMSFLHIDYYEQRARGGAGLIIVENACVKYPEGSNGTTQIRIDHDNYIPRLYKLCENVHKHGTKIAIQLNHAGASAMESRIGMQPVSASNLPNKKNGAIPRALKKEEIESIANDYAAAARRAQIVGFDFVEIHAGHSYLISQFLSPLTNNRTDEYGGSLENRARFAKLVMSKVREAVGPHFPIIVRISADELLEGGNTLEDTLALLSYFQEEADIIDVSAGLVDSIQYQIDANYLKDGWRSYMAKAVRDRFEKPVITTGNIRDPKVAEEILESNTADFIGLGRQMIADPNWPNKIKYGKEDEIRKCISCNIGCAGHRIGLNRPIRCTVNPAVNAGWDYYKQKIKSSCNVVVIGGGSAGLEAACTAAEVGCTTFLIEKEKELGGLSRKISRIPEKYRVAFFPDYLVNRAKKLRNLITFTGMEADLSFIEQLKPDIIVNATGSAPLLPTIKGLYENLDQKNNKVSSIMKMMDSIDSYPQDCSNYHIAVVGGGAVGLDVVEFFANRGAKTTIIEMQPQVGKDLDVVTKTQVYGTLEKKQVNVMTNTALQEVCEDHFVVNVNDQEQQIHFDLGFVCLGMRSYAPMYQELLKHYEDTSVDVINIGDSVRARRIIDGVWEGRNILSVLQKRDLL